MPLMFNTVLSEAGIPLDDIRLLRHKDKRAEKGRTPFDLWRGNRMQFEVYQSTQAIRNRAKLDAQFWASFVGTPRDETVFVGIYRAKYKGLLDHDQPWPTGDGVDKAGTCDKFELKLDSRFRDLEGKLFVKWGDAPRSWIQRADRRNKRITGMLAGFVKQLPFDLLPTEELTPEQLFEGAVRTVAVNAYERNPRARKKCLDHFGAICSVCDFDFTAFYGTIGKGYIHVHHLKDLATIGHKYQVNPIDDLRPVCPNCHAMLHVKKPAMAIEKLRAIVKSHGERK